MVKENNALRSKHEINLRIELNQLREKLRKNLVNIENLINIKQYNMLIRCRIRLLSSSLESWIQISHRNCHNNILLFDPLHPSLYVANNILKGNHKEYKLINEK